MAKSTESARLALGRKGEALAASHLERAGYAIVARNARTRWGELDLVARDGALWVFVEVKTRRGDRFGQGAEAVTYAKQQKIIRMAQIYLARQALWDVAIRFDVVEVSFDDGASPRIRHLVGAFGA
ncbi:MAG TPA: YraN family protein [Pantanalinema sp.]